jgi:hypothetical protein
MRTHLAWAATLAAACAPPAPHVRTIEPPTAPGTQASDATVARDPGNGDLLLSWVAGDSAGWHLYFSRSGDTGATWSAPVRVTRKTGDVHPHSESSPRLVAAPGVQALVWIASLPVPGRRWPASSVRFARSEDGGRSWSAPLTLNDDTSSAPAGHIFHGAAWMGDSALVVAWMDERPGPGTGHHVARYATADPEPMHSSDSRIYLAHSPDLGRTWSPNQPYREAACPCCRVALARGPDGGVRAAWRKVFPGSVRDVVVAPLNASTGETRVHTDDWSYPGCPHTGPGIAVGPHGETHVAWFRGVPGAAGVLYARAAAGREWFDAPVSLLHATTLPAAHPRVAALADGGALVVWDLGEDGRPALHAARVAGARASAPVRVPGSEGADHPELVALPDGGALVVWTERRDNVARVRLARLATR